MLRCRRVSDHLPAVRRRRRPPTPSRAGTGRAAPSGPVVRWSLVGGDRRFDFYVRRYANTLTWTYADDVSTPQVREEVADSLVARLEDLARR